MWTVSTLSLSSFPTHVLPVLLVRKRLCILCVPPKFHNLPSRGNIVVIDNLELVRFHKNEFTDDEMLCEPCELDSTENPLSLEIYPTLP